MKKILSINTTSFYSTGTIIRNIETGLSDEYEFYKISADESGDKIYHICKCFPIRHMMKLPTQIYGKDGFMYKHATKKAIKWIDELKPDLIHIHNVHGYYINLELLLNYIYSKNIPVVYTMHDCWTFTGRCAYFDSVHCDKWKTGCGNCPHKKAYPKSILLDKSGELWLKKKELLSNHNIHFVTPSNWLKNLAKESFLVNEDINVINNAINVSLYDKEITDYELPKEIDTSKKMILSVAFPFTKAKGLDDINKLQSLIDKDKYQIVAAGIEDEYKTVEGIVRIPPTTDRKFLAFLYQHAYVFVSFTYQDNYPTVLLESLASGTPVVTYDIGGCPEIATEGVGFTVKVGDVKSAYSKIEEISKIDRKTCKKAGQSHSIDRFVNEYHELYKRLLDK